MPIFRTWYSFSFIYDPELIGWIIYNKITRMLLKGHRPPSREKIPLALTCAYQRKSEQWYNNLLEAYSEEPSGSPASNLSKSSDQREQGSWPWSSRASAYYRTSSLKRFPLTEETTTGVQDMGEKALIAPAFVKADLSVEEDLETAVNRLGGGHIHKQCVVLNF